MESKNRKNRIVIILSLLLSIASMTVGYSAFQEKIIIDSNVYISNNRWSIKFNNVKMQSLEGKAEELYELNHSDNLIEFNVLFNEENDKITYTFDVENKGNIDAKLSSEPIIEILPLNFKDNISVKLTYDDGLPIKENDILLSNKKRSFRITVEYFSETDFAAEELSSVSLKVFLLYSQM